MKEFKNFKEAYRSQRPDYTGVESFQDITLKGKRIKRKQYLAQVILVLTIIALVVFFVYVSAYRNRTVSFAAALMIGSLVLRVILEAIYTFRSNSVTPTVSFAVFRKRLDSYYRKRFYINYLVTPLLFGLYIVGFVMLLPYFKASLSAGFYIYIQWSSIVVFMALAILFFVQGRKELANLKSMVHDL